MKGKVNDLKKSKTNVFRVLSVILMLVMGGICCEW